MVDVRANRQHEILRQTTPFIILATFAVLARYSARKLRRIALGADDWAIFLGLVFAWCEYGLVIAEIHSGLGKHSAVIADDDLSRHYKVTFAASINYATGISAVKSSILLLYSRIFPVPRFVLATRIVGGFVVAWWIVVIIIQIFSCNPIHGFWDTTIPSNCINAADFYVAVAVPNILTDIVMLMLPIRMVWRLQLPREQKLMLSVVFSTGAFVIVASLYRVVLLNQANRTDPLWSYTDVHIWTSIELSVGVVSGCLPVLRPLILTLWSHTRQISRLLSSKTTLHQKSRQGGGGGGDSIKLHSNFATDFQKPSNAVHKEWIGGLGHHAAGGEATASADPERDDRLLLPGINVQKDVYVERGIV